MAASSAKNVGYSKCLERAGVMNLNGRRSGLCKEKIMSSLTRDNPLYRHTNIICEEIEELLPALYHTKKLAHFVTVKNLDFLHVL